MLIYFARGYTLCKLKLIDINSLIVGLGNSNFTCDDNKEEKKV